MTYLVNEVSTYGLHSRPAPLPLPPTAALASRAAAVTFDELPGEVVLLAKQCLLDTVGVAIAGASEPVTRILRATIDADWAAGDGPGPNAGRDSGPSSFLDGTGRRGSAWTAALVNGTAAHALDFDDMHPAMSSHPSAPLVPALLAVGEAIGASGPALLSALVAGFELECRVGAAMMPSHYARGFHTTGTVGSLGAAAGVAHLLGFSARQFEETLGVAASGGAGLKIVFGTMTKPLQAGRAAANGVLAARLVEQGLTSALGVIEGAHGLAATQADALDLTILGQPFGAPWTILSNVFKLHAACGFTHGAIDAALAVRGQLDPAKIKTVDLEVHPDLLSAANIEQPTTPLEAKFSVRFVTALALASGQVAAEQFVPSVIGDAALGRIAASIRLVAVPDLPRLGARLTVTTDDCAVSTAVRDAGQPHWQDTPAEQSAQLTAKFDSLVAPVLGSARSRLLQEAIMTAEALPDVRALLRRAAE